MNTLRSFCFRFRGLFGKASRERELEEELQSHLALHIDDNLRAGMTPEQARREALLKLGGLESLKEACRDGHSITWIEHCLLDLRFALRQLRKNPGFTLAAISVLALGTCASIAIFSFVDAALIKPLPYPNPSNLVAVTESIPLIPRANLSYLDYLDWKRLNTVFLSFDVFKGSGFLLNTRSGAEPVRAGGVSTGFFRTLGIAPSLGRDFLESEGVANAPRVVMLSYGTWQRRFAARKSVVGELLNLSGQQYTIIGVVPAHFVFAPLGEPEFWTVVDPNASCEKRRSCHNLDGIARLKSGISVKAALANVSAIAKRLEAQYPESNRGQGASVLPASDVIVGEIRPILLVLMAGAGLLLLIACVNVASLVLVRAEARSREMAVRSALGASLARRFTQLGTEALVLVLAGVSAGLFLAMWTIEMLKLLIPAKMLPSMPFVADIGLSPRVLLFAAGVALISVLLFAVVPALHLATSKLRDSLAEGTRGSAGNTWRRVGAQLVVIELALAMMLMVGAGLFSKSLYRLLHVELGFQPDHLATLAVAGPDFPIGKPEAGAALSRDVLQKVQGLPGVLSAAAGTQLPVTFNGNTTWIRIVGKPYDGKHLEVNERDVSEKYLQTIQAKLLRGRYFTEADDLSKRKVLIINQALARLYFPGEDPLGQQIGDTELTPASLKTIVGVVEDIKDGALDSEIWPAVYHPLNQDPSSYFSLIVRTSQSPESVLQTIASAVHRVHPDLGTLDEATMEGRIRNSTTAYLHSSSAWLVGGFASLALLLSIIGLYGVVAYSVSQRTREIGVRMALGAERASVYRLVMKEAVRLAAFGAAFGVVGSISAAALAQKLLFRVSSWDPETLLGVTALLCAAAFAATLGPARRAVSVNPVEALRSE